MNSQSSVPITPAASPAPASSAPVASSTSSASVAPIDYRAFVEAAGFIPSPELVAAVCERHREMLTPKVILQTFQRLQKEAAANRIAQSNRGGKS